MARQGKDFHILTNTRNVMTCSTVVSLSLVELQDKSNQTRVEDHIKEMESNIGNYSHAISKLIKYKCDDTYIDMFE